MKNIANTKNIKVEATFIIWGCTTGIMAICIPLVSASGTGAILPLAVIIGASASTISVWISDREKDSKPSNNLQQIEQRIRNLETICTQENNSLNF